jgi:spore maturation protein SpmA
MSRRATFWAIVTGSLIAGLFIAVGGIQSYLVTHDQLHDQLGFLAIQMTWIVLIPASLLIAWLSRRLAAQPRSALLASVLAGFLGGIGCIIANALLQAVRQDHLNESYPGIMPAFLLTSFLLVLALGPLLGGIVGVFGPLLRTSQPKAE